MNIPNFPPPPVALIEQEAASISQLDPGLELLDFGRVAFGNLMLLPPPGARGEILVRFGESLKDARIDRKPPGTVRYYEVRVSLDPGTPLIVEPPVDHFNSEGRGRVKTPAPWGVLTPFRWVEIEGWPGVLECASVRRRAAFAEGWQDNAADFWCSDEMLNRIWDLCRYSIKATTFAGVYVDGDRERTPYEADAYINQICHYACDPDPRMARATFDFLLETPTWPTEWALHMPLILHADWMQTGDLEWLRSRFGELGPKLLESRLRPDGLLGSAPEHITHDDIVDWPPVERDGFVMSPCNAVVNAFYIHCLSLMAEMAAALGLRDEAESHARRAQTARAAFHKIFFDEARGVYRDGEGESHASAHANLFPLAFGLVPNEHKPGVIAHLESRGMACSVYAAHYLLEGLFENDGAALALDLMTRAGDRSWRHMVESGATITWEAWDQKYKPNLDWNHAWGAAPANLLPRHVLGLRASEPGWKAVLVRPRTAQLAECRGKIPTPRGAVATHWKNGEAFSLALSAPPGTRIRFELPAPPDAGVRVNGASVSFEHVGGRACFRHEPQGPVDLEIEVSCRPVAR